MFAIVSNGHVVATTPTPRRVVVGNTTVEPTDYCKPASIALGVMPLVEQQPAHHAETQDLQGPTYQILFDRVVAVYTAADVTVEVARARSIQAVKDWRNDRELDPFLHLDLWFAGNEKAARRLTQEAFVAQTAASASAPYTNSWQAIDGQLLEIADAAAMLALVNARTTAFAAVFQASLSAIAAIEAASTVVAIRAALDAYRSSHRKPELLSATAYQRHVRALQFGVPADPTRLYVDLGATAP